jgi:hypothetical protein
MRFPGARFPREDSDRAGSGAGELFPLVIGQALDRVNVWPLNFHHWN